MEKLGKYALKRSPAVFDAAYTALVEMFYMFELRELAEFSRICEEAWGKESRSNLKNRKEV